MSWVEINAALIQSYQNVGLNLATAYEGRDFTPPSGTSWASVFNLPASSNVDTLGAGGADLHVGILQIDVNSPANVGTATLLNAAATLRTAFYAGRNLTYSGQSVRIKQASRSAIRRVDGWLRISVSITYWAQTARP